MASQANEQIRSDLMDAVAAGHTVQEMATLIGRSDNYTSTLLTELVRAGKLERLSKGRYLVKRLTPTNANGVRPYAPNGNGSAHLAEATSRKVQLPDYMKTRSAITVFVERSPEELEGVLRLELCINGAWLPIPVIGDIRLCVGDDVPRWSATQEIYADVKSFRITLRDGSQSEYTHNPSAPLTIDRKVSQ